MIRSFVTPFVQWFRLLFLLLPLVSLTGCATIKLGPSYDEPIKEQLLEKGSSEKKVLIININGIISDLRNPGLLGSSPSLLDRVMSQLKRAEKDPNIVTLLLKVNSPGGSVTASDILYHELQEFKKRTGKKVFVQMMDIAASGGVYVAMAADHIQAHPSTMTGSVGVITLNADLSGTLEKIGARVNVYKTGENKDMGSPFRAPSETDKAAFQGMIDDMALRFFGLVKDQRKLDDEQMQAIMKAQVYSGNSAKEIGLVDSLGYLSDATKQACELAEQTGCQVVTYRYQTNANATAYSPSMQADQSARLKLIDLPIMQKLNLPAGNYYLYLD